jgi:hypothetical protein
MEIIAYGIVAKAPSSLLIREERTARLWNLTMIVDHDCNMSIDKPGYYQVMVTTSVVRHLVPRLGAGTSILVRGRVVEDDPLALDSEWNHRIVMAESIEILLGTLSTGRAFLLPQHTQSGSTHTALSESAPIAYSFEE